ncbi:MAG: hypothetical protein NT062_12400 [Proteobacteria bacterium]|nr:hypothetical protein [Pseudomonadota bacterium]
MALLAELRARDWMPEPDAFEPTKRNVLAIVATGPKSFRSIASELRENCAGVGDRALRLAIRELEDEKVVIHFGRGRASVYELAIRSRSRLQIVAES